MLNEAFNEFLEKYCPSDIFVTIYTWQLITDIMILTLTSRWSLQIAIIISYLVVKIQYKEFKEET